MTTIPEAVAKCPDCPKVFDYRGEAYFDHRKQAHPSPAQKAANTRRRNDEAKDKLAAEAKARMVAASERVIERSYYMGLNAPGVYHVRLTYELHPNKYTLEQQCRRPTPEALAAIETFEAQLANVQKWLEASNAFAWETGVPVTEAEVLAARAAGKVTP